MKSVSLKIAQVSAGTSITLGVLTLIGWLFNVTFFKSISAGLVPLKANAAIEFVLVGLFIILWTLRRPDSSEKHSSKLILTIILWVFIIISFLTMLEYIIGDLGIDQLLFSDNSSLSVHPGRMAPNAVLLFLLTGVALILFSSKIKFKNKGLVSGILGLVVSSAGAFSIADYPWFGSENLIGNFNPMAIQAAIGFSILGAGIFSLSFELDKTPWSLKRSITISFICGMLIVIGMDVFSNLGLIKMQDSAQMVSHTREVEYHIAQLSNSIQQVEINRQIYLLTGDKDYREISLKAWNTINSELEVFNKLTNDNPNQIARSNKLSELLKRRLEILYKTYSAYEMNGNSPKANQLFFNQRDEILTQINRLLDEANAEERGLLSVREESSNSISRKIFFLVPLGSLVSTAVLVWIFMLLNSEVSVRKQSESALKKSEEKLRQSNLYNRSLLEANLDPLVTINTEGKITDANRAVEKVTGAIRKSLIGSDFSDYFTEPENANNGYQKVFSEGFVQGYPLTIKHKSGKLTDVIYNASTYYNEKGEIQGVFAAARDITELKKAEEHLNRLNRLYAVLSQISHTIVEINDKQKLFDESCRILVEYGNFKLAWLGEIDGKTNLIKPVASFGDTGKYLDKILISTSDSKFQKGPTGIAISTRQYNVCNDIKNDPRMEPWRDHALSLNFRSSAAFPIIQPGKMPIPLTVYSSEPGFFNDDEISLMNAISLEISFALQSFEKEDERRKMEEEIHLASIYNRSLLEASLDPLVTINNEGKITDLNEAVEHATGFPREEILGSDFSNYFTEPDKAKNGYQKVFSEGLVKDYPLTIQHKSGKQTDVLYNATTYKNESGEIQGVFAAARDITELRKKEIELFKLNEDLNRSNKELEQFAYVASHDLQEPLRMVASFTQLIEKRYSDKLDSDALEFIKFAVDGAMRMQRLITDLLDYSRVTTRGKPLVKFELSKAFGMAVANLHNKIQDSGAIIISGDLPIVQGDEIQLMRVFQNLLENAIKFRDIDAPKIIVQSKIENNQALISIQDNGIGIDYKYKDRVFVIFQRLHGAANYPGTGIGLAICKRTIERHGGKIWFESEPGKGTTFKFLLNI